MSTAILSRSSVLANAFTLVGISMLPTIAGAFVGMEYLPQLAQQSPWMTLIGLLLVTFASLGLVFVTSSSALGILTMNGFAFVMGNVLSISLWYGLEKYSNAGQLIALAAAGTLATTVVASGYALTTKRDFVSMGGTLFMALIGLIVMGILNAFIQVPVLGLIISMIGVVVFTLYIIHDVQNTVRGGETNYIIVATGMYLNIINLFSYLLDIIFSGLGDD